VLVVLDDRVVVAGFEDSDAQLASDAGLGIATVGLRRPHEEF